MVSIAGTKQSIVGLRDVKKELLQYEIEKIVFGWKRTHKPIFGLSDVNSCVILFIGM